MEDYKIIAFLILEVESGGKVMILTLAGLGLGGDRRHCPRAEDSAGNIRHLGRPVGEGARCGQTAQPSGGKNYMAL